MKRAYHSPRAGRAIGLLIVWLAMQLAATHHAWGAPRTTPEAGLVDTTFGASAMAHPDTARILRREGATARRGPAGPDTARMDTVARREAARPVEKDSTVVYDPGIFGHVHRLEALNRTHRWELDTEGWRYRHRTLDSSFTNVHLFSTPEPHFATKNSVGLVYGPYQSDDFFARPTAEKDLPPGIGNTPLLLAPPEMYSTLGPYARFSAISGGHSARGVLLGDLLMTNNILPSLNMGITFRHAEDKTEYANHRVSLNAARAFLSFSKGRLFANLTGDLGRYDLNTNGGIQSKAWHLDSVRDEAVVPVRITNGEARIRQHRIALDASFDLLGLLHEIPDSTNVERLYREPTISLITLQRLEGQTRSYLDYKLGPDTGPHHISNEYTNDSIARLAYDGRLGLAYHHSPHATLRFPSLRAWTGYRISRYTMGKPFQYLNPQLEQREQSLYLGAALDYDFPIGHLEADGQFHLWGAHRLDIRLQATLDLYIPRWKDRLALALSFEMAAEKPGHFAQRYYSNNRIWDVRGQLRRELYTGLGAELKAPWWGGKYGARGRIYQYYFYFDETGKPQQISNITILSAWAEESILLYGVGLRARAQLQHASNDGALGLPLLNLYGELGYQYEVVRNALTLRLSLEMYYRSKHLADQYDSPLGVFHRQRTFELGGYPMANLVLSGKWKTVELYVMAMHVDEGLFGRDFFDGVLYPALERDIRFGLKWNFYS
ncbi:MAG: hypothetical protein CSA07_02565 [Bacteroidia bacterium]|nr:MAG: hypothetical protein CSA07_02565 [Bacteroidia bacterium]